MVKNITSIVFAFLLFLFFSKNIFAAYTPPAKISFTFDDSNDRIFDNALPVLNQYNFPAVEYAEVALLETNQDWVMTWDQIKQLQNQYAWEIGSHSVNHIDLTTATEAQLEEEVTNSRNIFLSHGLNINSFSTPYGVFNNQVLKKIAKNYTSHRMAWGGPNVYPAIHNDYQLVVYEVKHDITPATVFTWIDSAVTNKQWLILLLHDIVDATATEYTYNKDDFKKIVDYVASKPIQVTTLTQGINLSNQPNLISNGSFEIVSNNFPESWSRNRPAKVTLDSSQNGNAPHPKNSIKIVGGINRNDLFTSSLPVNTNSNYIFKLFVDGTNYLSGSWAAAAVEKKADGSTLRTKRLFTINSSFFGSRSVSYKPSSVDVATVQIRIFSLANSNLTLYIDSVEFKPVTLTLPIPTLTPTSTPTPILTTTPSPAPTVTITPPINNLLVNGSFEVLENGFAANWSRNNESSINIDTNNNGISPFPQNSLKIVAGIDQYTAFSPSIVIPDSLSNYTLSYYLKTDNFQSGGTAAWIDEFDSQNNYLGGQWLGGRYASVNELIVYNYQPSSDKVHHIQVHLFTEINSLMTAYFDQVSLSKN